MALNIYNARSWFRPGSLEADGERVVAVGGGNDYHLVVTHIPGDDRYGWTCWLRRRGTDYRPGEFLCVAVGESREAATREALERGRRRHDIDRPRPAAYVTPRCSQCRAELVAGDGRGTCRACLTAATEAAERERGDYLRRTEPLVSKRLAFSVTLRALREREAALAGVVEAATEAARTAGRGRKRDATAHLESMTILWRESAFAADLVERLLADLT